MSGTASTLDYGEAPRRVSRLALAAFCLAILAACGFFLVIPPLVALVVGMVAVSHVRRHPTLSGKGFANAAVTISTCAFCLGMRTALFLPSLGGASSAPRSPCAANIRGIMQALVVYSNDYNDKFPVAAYAPYSPRLNNPSASPPSAAAADALRAYYGPGHPQAGSVTAGFWMLVLNGQISPKQFICRTDPFARSTSLVSDTHGNFYDNFQRGDQLSYSFAYPWKADGTVGNWWKNTNDADLPIAADMTPLQGTGKPPCNLTPLRPPASPRTWNSANHQGDGQNVGFADGHSEFFRRPTCGHNNDNIYTTSGRPSTGPAEFGGIPAGKTSPALTADKPPFDIIMLPVRDAGSGAM